MNHDLKNAALKHPKNVLIFQNQDSKSRNCVVFHVKTQEDEVSFMPCLYYILYILHVYMYIGMYYT